MGAHAAPIGSKVRAVRLHTRRLRHDVTRQWLFRYQTALHRTLLVAAPPHASVPTFAPAIHTLSRACVVHTRRCGMGRTCRLGHRSTPFWRQSFLNEVMPNENAVDASLCVKWKSAAIRSYVASERSYCTRCRRSVVVPTLPCTLRSGTAKEKPNGADGPALGVIVPFGFRLALSIF